MKKQYDTIDHSAKQFDEAANGSYQSRLRRYQSNAHLENPNKET